MVKTTPGGLFLFTSLTLSSRRRHHTYIEHKHACTALSASHQVQRYSSLPGPPNRNILSTSLALPNSHSVHAAKRDFSSPCPLLSLQLLLHSTAQYSTVLYCTQNAGKYVVYSKCTITYFTCTRHCYICLLEGDTQSGPTRPRCRHPPSYSLTQYLVIDSPGSGS